MNDCEKALFLTTVTNSHPIECSSLSTSSSVRLFLELSIIRDIYRTVFFLFIRMKKTNYLSVCSDG